MERSWAIIVKSMAILKWMIFEKMNQKLFIVGSMTKSEVNALIDQRFVEETGKALKGDKRGPTPMLLQDIGFRRAN